MVNLTVQFVRHDGYPDLLFVNGVSLPGTIKDYQETAEAFLSVNEIGDFNVSTPPSHGYMKTRRRAHA